MSTFESTLSLEALQEELSALGDSASRTSSATVIVRVAPVDVAAASLGGGAPGRGVGAIGGGGRDPLQLGALRVSERCIAVQPPAPGGAGGGTAAAAAAQRYDVTLALPPDALEADISAAAGSPSIAALLQGQDAAIVSFGKCSLGKSGCVMGHGGGGSSASSGLLNRVLEELFDRIALEDHGTPAQARASAAGCALPHYRMW